MTRLGAFVTVLLLCGLAACEDEPTPDIPNPTPSSSSPSVTESTSSPTESSEPPEVLTPEETVRAWVAAHNKSLATGDLADEMALATVDCLGCEAVSGAIEEVYAAGGNYVGGAWRLVSTNVDEQSEAAVKLSAGFKVAPGVLTAEAGAEPLEYEAENHLMRMELTREDGRWLFTVIALIS